MFFERTLKIIDSVNEYTGRLISLLPIFMTFSIVYEVGARYIFNNPTIWSMEVNQYILCGYTALGGGYALLHRSHVSVEILVERWNLRTRAALNIITSPLFFVFVWVLIVKSYEMAAESWHYWERSESQLAAPLFPSQIVIPLGGVLLLLQGVATLIRDFCALITNEEPPDP